MLGVFDKDDAKDALITLAKQVLGPKPEGHFENMHVRFGGEDRAIENMMSAIGLRLFVTGPFIVKEMAVIKDAKPSIQFKDATLNRIWQPVRDEWVNAVAKATDRYEKFEAHFNAYRELCAFYDYDIVTGYPKEQSASSAPVLAA